MNHATVLALILILCAGCASRDCACPGPATAASYDGLVPVSQTRMQRVWVRPGLSLSGYRKLLLEDLEIQYRPVTEALPSGLENPALAFPLDEDTRRRLDQAASEVLLESLAHLELPVVAEPGPDVLSVRARLLDVAVAETDGGYRVAPIGQLTFAVELVDSETGSVLVRAVDTRAGHAPGQPGAAVVDGSDETLRALLTHWAALVADALNHLTRLDQLQEATNA